MCSLGCHLAYWMRDAVQTPGICEIPIPRISVLKKCCLRVTCVPRRATLSSRTSWPAADKIVESGKRVNCRHQGVLQKYTVELVSELCRPENRRSRHCQPQRGRQILLSRDHSGGRVTIDAMVASIRRTPTRPPRTFPPEVVVLCCPASCCWGASRQVLSLQNLGQL